MEIVYKNFRDIYKKICLLKSESLVEQTDFNKVFDYPPEEKIDGFLVYGFINGESKFVFEILAGAKVSEGRIKIFPASYKNRVNVFRGDIDESYIQKVSDDYSEAFKDKLQMINDDTDGEKERLRRVEMIDAQRHPFFPDDVLVYFFAEGFQLERAWVRCVSAEGKIICGVLLNELEQKNFGYKIGDIVNFGVTEFDKEMICVLIRDEKF